MINNYTWSYLKESVPLSIKVEYVLKFGNLDEISEVIKQAGFDFCKNIWINKVIPDKRFDRLSYFLARFVFNISTERTKILEYLQHHKRKRFERF